MKKISIQLFIVLFLLLSCQKKEGVKLFKKVPSSTSGVHFVNQLKDTPELNILTYLYYYNGGGVAVADFNNDGLMDLYFTANQGPDKLYLNQGHLKFKDVTSEAHLDNTGNWTTGVTHIDINNDGLLDLYICKVGNYGNIKGNNLLYVNQGVNANGIPIFKEEAALYGLDFSGFSTHAAFFDYDLDGDLDMYLMNHSVHPNRAYGKGIQRTQMDSLSGDRLYQNHNGKFMDVSSASGIFQSKVGYGLGLGISDLNNDGYPDIYVGNDFFENDYLYINQKDGTFKEVISNDDKKLGHTTHFSMGNDMADINNDGLADIISLDMLPENMETYKASGVEYAFPTYAYYLKNGYAPQYMQNTLHLNLNHGNFSEIGNLSGVPATEWSWGPLLADYDNDGNKDLFISNGIKGATNDMDFISFIANENIQKRINKGMTREDMALIKEMPKKKVSNYLFKNNGDLTFTDVTATWYQKEDSYSNGCAYADLDNDGDLDIIVNNVDEEAYIMENTAATNTHNHYLKIGFKGGKSNPFGIGAKVLTYVKNKVIVQENYVSRGYLSAVPPTINIGLGKDSIVDSIKVIWPNKKYQTLKNITSDQKLRLRESIAQGNYYQHIHTRKAPLTNETSPIAFAHAEEPTMEFLRDPLIPFANTNEGPDVSVADINNDGFNDFFIGGAKRQASVLFEQDSHGNFKSVQQKTFAEDAISEDVSQVFFDANGDGFMDLLVVSGGNEFKKGKPLHPRLYRNIHGVFQKDENAFANIEVNASKVDAVDFDNDGDMDIAISSDQVPWKFGATPKQFLFKNDGSGHFQQVTSEMSEAFLNIGNVKDFVWKDLDGNGFKDLIAVGYWMPISIFMNDGKTLTLKKNNGLDATNGWWNTLKIADFDNDGDMDLVVGNWGLNSRLKASKEKPITLYSYDFDANGTVDPVVTYFYKDKETPFASKDELAKQMPFLNKKFLSYSNFAKAGMEDLFTSQKLQKALKKRVFTLASCYFESDGKGVFNKKELPLIAQVSTIQDIAVQDFNHDGFKDVLIVGNNYEISTQLGRLDALRGTILINQKNGRFKWAEEQNFSIPGPARNIQKITFNHTDHYMITINNGTPVFLTINK